MPDESPPAGAAEDPEDPAELFARFRAERPEGDSAAFEAWLCASGHALPDERFAALARDVLGRLEDDADDPARSAFAPRGRETRPPSSFRSGEAIGGFVLRRFLAAGGMGQVWEADDAALDRAVALKLLLPGRVDERALEHFAREARAGGRLRHPNLVTTYAHGWDEGICWIAQELVPGARTLKDLLDEARARPAVPGDHYRRMAELVAALADGLHAAHEAGVIHRDVKPANVLLDAEGRPRLTDFGIARVSDESALSKSGEVAGTWAYMSPEQVRARRGAIDRRTDVFSLGVVLYELLTLRRPFEGDTVQQTAEQILALDPPEPTSLRSGCPRDLSLICLKAMEKTRGRRYATAGDLAADLRRHLASEPIEARAPSRVDRGLRWLRRHPAVSTGAAVGALALVAVSVLLVRKVADARELEVLAAQRGEEARAAQAERDAVLRLSAAVEVEELVERQRELWPPHPAQLAGMRRWVADAERLVAGLPEHRATLEELSSPSNEDADEETAWWRQRQAELVTALETLRDQLLAADVVTPEHGWSVPRRVAFAESLAASFGPDGEHTRAWREALPEMRRAVPGVELEPIVGLVPLGPDPRSGLWELAHLATGAPPARAADGELARTDDSGVVLVLVPGGTFWMGTQSEDPDGPNHEPDPIPFKPFRPLREVTLSPYLISKYELTQGQWLRLTGANPSGTAAGEEGVTRLHPVESLSWDDATRALGRVALSLPTEAQWEHACRAGSSTPYAFGDELAARGKMNMYDRTAIEAGARGATFPGSIEHEDGAVVHAPVGTWPANAFGLHEVHGNVGEIVLDAARFDEYRPDEPTVDPLVDPEENERRIVRGGSYAVPAAACRSYVRMDMTRSARGVMTGVRPGRRLPSPERR